MGKNETTLDILEVGPYKVLKFNSKPPRLEAQIVFDRDDLSQKLIFTIMDISYGHGFACSPPNYKDANDPNMSFLIGTIIPNRFLFKKHLHRLVMCLDDIDAFLKYFTNQLDFSKIDLSMFGGLDLQQFNPSEIAAVKDQHFNGSWVEFKTAMLLENKMETASVVEKCMAFEKQNNKDLGLVAHKLDQTLFMIENQHQDKTNVN